MSGREAILAIDAGTSGTRAAVVTANGQVSCLHHLPLPIHSPQSGVVEQDAALIWQHTLAVCRATLQQARQKRLQVRAIGLCNQRASAVLWDTVSGQPLAPALVWQDSRHAAQLAKLAVHWERRLRPRLGRPLGPRSPYLWAAHLLRSDPAVAQAWRQRRLGFGSIDTWLLWQLSAGRLLATSATNATACNAYCLDEHAYALDWLQALDFPLELLPPLYQDADDYGMSEASVLGAALPIRACAGDQLAGAIGLGCLAAGQALCVHGTGSFINLLVGTRAPLAAGISEQSGSVVVTARRQQGVSHFALESFCATTGAVLTWACQRQRWFPHARALLSLAASVPHAGGVSFVPALAGIQAPQRHSGARAALQGLSLASSRAEIAHALVEGIAQAVAACVHANAEVAGLPVTQLMSGGGLSASDLLLQLQADLTGVPTYRTHQAAHASLRGIAYLAGSQGLLWDDLPQACARTRLRAVFEPRLDAAARTARRAPWQARVAAELAYAGRDTAH
ncbi:FGGY family carbohydrate kinase [uncultured Herbaspirillum sp.]|uniref:FGGY family carbohydrate kinase n=1 Tax=uncultured Herbaspirillum sp. TaxID=160236 RepID=UPI00258E5531|nr:FGGY family carbohydrate kinase [uncultured Herbaspirillum sp.]